MYIGIVCRERQYVYEGNNRDKLCEKALIKEYAVTDLHKVILVSEGN